VGSCGHEQQLAEHYVHHVAVLGQRQQKQKPLVGVDPGVRMTCAAEDPKRCTLVHDPRLDFDHAVEQAARVDALEILPRYVTVDHVRDDGTHEAVTEPERLAPTSTRNR